MAVRLAVVFLAALIVGCDSGGGSSTTILPSSQWGRARSDSFNSGVGAATFANHAGGQITVPLGAPIDTTPAIGVAGNVFVVTRDGRVFAFEPDLTELWRFTPPNDDFTPPLGTTRSSLAVDPFDIVYYGTDTGYVVAVSSNGFLEWTANLGSAVVGSPMLILDPVFNSTQALVVGTAAGEIVAIGGDDGQVRWRFRTGGAVEGSVAFDGVNIYAASKSGSLFAVTQRGTQSFPPSGLGPLADVFAPSPSFLAQVVAVGGLAGTSGGRVRGITVSGLVPIWDAEFESPVHTSPTQISRAVDQAFYGDDGTESTAVVGVIDYVVVEDDGTAWLVDSNLGTFGTRCIGGLDDQKACRTDSDCRPTTTTPVVDGTCQPIAQCVGGANAGQVCRKPVNSTSEDDCPGGACTWITSCKGGTNEGEQCANDDECPGGTCDLSVFSVGARVQASPVSTGDGTIIVATAPASGGGTVYFVDLPNMDPPITPVVGDCGDVAFCRVAFNDDGNLGAVTASPAVNASGTVYFGDDKGTLYAILDEEL